jgi:hypothetical protein
MQLCQGTARRTHRQFLPVLLAAVICFAWTNCKAQQPDSAILQSRIRAPSPKKAIAYSAILPGMGQIYNHKYWKVPIIYGAGGALVYFVGFWQNKYTKFRDAIELGSNQDNPEPVIIEGRTYNYEDLKRPLNGYRRYRDLCVLGFGAVYALNIIDAMIDAHFFYYDISNDLSLRIEPAVMNGPDANAVFGLGLQLGF